MEQHTPGILKEYDTQKNLYADFVAKCDSLIRDLLKDESMKFHQITNRIKERNKLEDKIKKKNHKYSSISQITDICGIRIITYFEDEVDLIAKIIEKEFKIDKENSIDKRQLSDDKFGYRSLHYIVSLDKSRSKLPEYKKFSDLKLEFQVRTILQHSWAEIQHDIGYKGEVEIPQVARRSFYRIAALLETADIEFSKVKTVLKEYEHTVGDEIKTAPETVSLDKTSLRSFIKTSKIIKGYHRKIGNYSKVPISETSSDYDELIHRLNKVGIKTIKQLNESLTEKAEECFASYKRMHPPTEKLSGISNVTFLFHLVFVLTGQKA